MAASLVSKRAVKTARALEAAESAVVASRQEQEPSSVGNVGAIQQTTLTSRIPAGQQGSRSREKVNTSAYNSHFCLVHWAQLQTAHWPRLSECLSFKLDRLIAGELMAHAAQLLPPAPPFAEDSEFGFGNSESDIMDDSHTGSTALVISATEPVLGKHRRARGGGKIDLERSSPSSSSSVRTARIGPGGAQVELFVGNDTVSEVTEYAKASTVSYLEAHSEDPLSVYNCTRSLGSLRALTAPASWAVSRARACAHP